MRAQTQESLARRIDRVLAHLAGALDQPLSLDALAEVACLSRFHFHRCYSALLGETPAETLRRLRLTRAAGELVNGRRPLCEIAARAGYGSLPAFVRAFAAAYGQPPGSFRAAALPPPALAAGKAGPLPRGYRAQLARQAPMTLAGVRHRGPYIEIGTAFDRLFLWAGRQGLLGPQTLSLGLYWDDPAAVPARDLRAAACITVPQGLAALPPDGGRHDLPGGPVALVRHRGPYAELEKAYSWLYRCWLPASGRTPADLPCFEIYRNDPRQTSPAELLTDVCMLMEPEGTPGAGSRSQR